MGTSKSGNWSSLSDIDRFLEKISKDENDCWNWQRQLNNKGYGVFWHKSKCHLAHRWSYQFYNKKDLPSTIYICHKCDNPKCVNPLHLFEGTPKDNSNDMINKKRLRGGKNHCHGLPFINTK